MIRARDIPLDRSLIHGRSAAADSAFTRALDDVCEKTPAEKRFDEYFSCDCNDELIDSRLSEMEKMDDESAFDEPDDFVFTINDPVDEVRK